MPRADAGDLETPRLLRILDALLEHPAVHYAVRQNTGGATFKGRYVAFGYEGQADITGMLAGGRRLEVEVKRPGEWPELETFEAWAAGHDRRGNPVQLTRERKRLLAQWRNQVMVNAGGGLAFVAYDVDDVVRELGEPAEALEALRQLDPARFRSEVVRAATGRGRRRPKRGRWHELPEHVQGREQ